MKKKCKECICSESSVMTTTQRIAMRRSASLLLRRPCRLNQTIYD
jgi:hypothetical protein